MHLDNSQRLHRNVQQRQGATLASLCVDHPVWRSQTHFHCPYALLRKLPSYTLSQKRYFYFSKKRLVTKYCVQVRKATLQQDLVVIA